jgi:D-alanyl-lipoteichoic acid acyltransferase DltB (MBOAT superfamily)
MTVFVLSGMCHGAAWTFVIWGAIDGTYMAVGEVTGWFREWLFRPLRQRRWFQLLQMPVTFNLVNASVGKRSRPDAPGQPSGRCQFGVRLSRPFSPR